MLQKKPLREFCAVLHANVVRLGEESDLNADEIAIIKKLSKNNKSDFSGLTNAEFTCLQTSEKRDLRVIRDIYKPEFAAAVQQLLDGGLSCVERRPR